MMTKWLFFMAELVACVLDKFREEGRKLRRKPALRKRTPASPFCRCIPLDFCNSRSHTLEEGRIRCNFHLSTLNDTCRYYVIEVKWCNWAELARFGGLDRQPAPAWRAGTTVSTSRTNSAPFATLFPFSLALKECVTLLLTCILQGRRKSLSQDRIQFCR